MNLDAVERCVLWASVEDFLGLWEVAYLLAGGCPDVAEGERPSVARSTVGALLERGYVRLWRRKGSWGRPAPLSAEEVADALAESAYWEAPVPDAPNLLVASTAEGRALFLAGT
jgi:hypothetical protein